MINCRKCGIELTDDTWFKSGMKYYNYICKDCNNKWSRNYHYENKDIRNIKKREYARKHPEMYKKHRKVQYLKDKALMHLLKINGCALCGYNLCDGALDFHHTNPDDKKFGITLHNTHKLNDNVINEIEKCILFCKNCHAEIHSGLNKN